MNYKQKVKLYKLGILYSCSNTFLTEKHKKAKFKITKN